MGMAASQARYLALTARKTNTEYEGQQINQARTALANQSANLFNQLLALEVPTAPKTTDYTELQYSYSDGQNNSVLSNWKQLSTSDSEYNYIVDHYYYADLYKGSKKLLQNPQVQATDTVASSYKWDDLAESMTGTKSPLPRVEFDAATGKIKINGVVVPGYTYSKCSDLPAEKKQTLDDAITAAGVTPLTADDWAFQDDNGVWHFMYANEIDEDTQKPSYDYKISRKKPTYVGNCELKELTALAEDQKTELHQILQDFPDSNLAQYLQIDNNNLLYAGSGIYTFRLNGKDYFTCDADLEESLNSTIGNDNPIENQDKLRYYNASYINSKIEEKNKALLETDGNGRFRSIKLDNDSLTYMLNTETVTDEAAYQDAMNEYNYKVRQYEQTIADINARTSIIQQEDRTLELRLRQLDTEQKALSTEMEAVKKVIGDNVKSTFETFKD